MDSQLSNYALRDLLTFFDRYELFLMSFSSKRLRLMIENEFPKAPYFICTSVWCLELLKSGGWGFHSHNNQTKITVPKAFRRKMADLKFLRFPTCKIILSSQSCGRLIPKISHFWERQTLTIVCCKFAPTSDLVSHFAKASKLELNCAFYNTNEAEDALKAVLTGNCKEIVVGERYSDQPIAIKLPIEELLDFLFRRENVDSNEKAVLQSLYLYTAACPGLQGDLLRAIEKRFLSSTQPHHNYFSWNGRYGRNRQMRHFHNERTNQTLGFVINAENDGFNMFVEDS